MTSGVRRVLIEFLRWNADDERGDEGLDGIGMKKKFN